jgi:hypothetical protein
MFGKHFTKWNGVESLKGMLALSLLNTFAFFVYFYSQSPINGIDIGVTLRRTIGGSF